MITAERLRELVHYDPETGVFTWKVGREAGKVAGSNGGHKYRRLWLDGRLHYAHRMAWLWVHGEMPRVIDHINGDGYDNRLANLRSCSQAQNIANGKKRSSNNSGFVGVRFRPEKGKWQARLMVNYRETHVGYFDTLQEACEARRKAAQEKFGEFYRAE